MKETLAALLTATLLLAQNPAAPAPAPKEPVKFAVTTQLVMLNLSAVVIAGGLAPEETTVAKSIEESIPLYTTPMSVFELAGKLHELGVRSA